MFSLRSSQRAIMALLLVALLAGCGGERTFSSAKLLGTDWRLTSSGSDNTLYAVAWSGNLFVAVGDRGIIRTSTDGIKWTDQVSGTGVALRDVAWCDSLFVAIGGGGIVLRSADGLTWENTNIPTSNILMAVSSGDGRITIVGNLGSYYVSEDAGASWANQPHFTTDLIIGIVWDNDQWLACTGLGSLFSSTDGSNWTEIWIDLPPNSDFNPEPWRSGFQSILATDIGYYITAILRDTVSWTIQTAIFNSIDGLHWEHRVSINHHIVDKLAWTGSEILAVGSAMPPGGSYAGSIYSSQDGRNWLKQVCDSPLDLKDATTGNSHVVVVGDRGYILSGTNASNLTVQTSGAAIVAVVWDGTRFVAATQYGSVMISPTGSDWAERVAEGVQTFKEIAFSGERFVAAGASNPVRIYYSDDAINWTQAATPANFRFAEAICWGNDRYVIAGRDGNVAVSTDGAGWTSYNAGTDNDLTAITHDGNRFIAGGFDMVLTSTDGITWDSTALNLDHTYSVTGIASSGKHYVAIATSSYGGPQTQPAILVSEDATTWEDVGSPTGHFLIEVRWTGTHFLICGEGGTLLSSKDGRNWTIHETGTTNNLRDIAVGPEQWVVVGNQRTVLVSP